MNRIIIAVTALVVSLAGGSFAGATWWVYRSGAAHASAHAATGYTCPMHPNYHSDHSDNCPICGMRLVEANRGQGATDGTDAAAPALPHGAVHVSHEGQQAVGIRLGVVKRLAGSRLLRTTGRVAADENRTYPIVAAVSGWIRNVDSVTTGDTVKKDQVLASLFAPDAQF
jgi:Cu(I)/Ag(I) efflux system membrane fusion protein